MTFLKKHENFIKSFLNVKALTSSNKIYILYPFLDFWNEFIFI